MPRRSDGDHVQSPGNQSSAEPTGTAPERPDDAPIAVSVVITTRNRPKMLAGCLAALRCQAPGRPAEVVVVDQSDPPLRLGARGAADALGNTALTLHYVESDEVGASRGRNRAVAASRGRIVAVTDDDCRPDPDWLARMLDAFDADPDLAMACGRVLLDGEHPPGTIPAAVHPSEAPATFRPGQDPSNIGSGNNVAFRREVLFAVRGYDERLGPGTPLHAGEDTELFYRVIREGHVARYQPAAVVYHAAWRDPDALIDLGWSYAVGSGAYLTREVIARRDCYALRLLARRLLWIGAVTCLGSVVLGKTWHRRAAWRRMLGTLRGIWAVVALDRSRGVDRAWVMKPPGSLRRAAS